MSKMRRSSNARLILMLALIIILAICYFVFEKFRLWILGLIAVLLVAVGLEVADTDVDLGKLVKTGSLQESMISKTDKGTWLIGECEKKANFNCDNFEYQEEAQALFEACGGPENDVHRLDGDNDGVVCEALKSRPEGEAAKSVWDILGWKSSDAEAMEDTGDEAEASDVEATGDAPTEEVPAAAGA